MPWHWTYSEAFVFLFEIDGKPIPQQQTRFYNGRCYDPSRKDKEQIQWQAKPYAPETLLTGPLKMCITFYFPVPKNVSVATRNAMINQRIYHIVRPDADNCAYLITNALKGIFYKDDSQIIDQNIHKRYGVNPKTVIKIVPIDNFKFYEADACD